MTLRARRSVDQHVLTVESTEWLGPHLVRVLLGGDSPAAFPDNGCTDAYLKLYFVDPALGLEPPYDLAELRETLPPEQRPVMRTYTVRHVDRDARRIAIDFVTHGDTGVAAPWAAAARPGDRLVTSSPGGGYAPRADVPWHVLAGDPSAVPAIGAALEALPATARGVALLEIGDPADIVDLHTDSTVDIRWMINPEPDDVGFLARAIEAAEVPAEGRQAGGVQMFVHGERESVKAVRAVLRPVPREDISISAYWPVAAPRTSSKRRSGSRSAASTDRGSDGGLGHVVTPDRQHSGLPDVGSTMTRSAEPVPLRAWPAHGAAHHTGTTSLPGRARRVCLLDV